MKDWAALAERLGPQSAPYMHPDEWAGHLRTVACPCGALLEIIDEDTPPPGEFLCDSCELRRAFTMEDADLDALIRKVVPS